MSFDEKQYEQKKVEFFKGMDAYTKRAFSSMYIETEILLKWRVFYYGFSNFERSAKCLDGVGKVTLKNMLKKAMPYKRNESWTCRFRKKFDYLESRAKQELFKITL